MAVDQSKVLAMADFFFFDSSLALESLAWSNWSSRKFSGRRSAKATNLLALMAWTRWAGTGGSPERGRIRSSTAELESSGATAVGVTAGGSSGGGGQLVGPPTRELPLTRGWGPGRGREAATWEQLAPGRTETLRRGVAQIRRKAG